jgi:hypothetical protein
MRTAITVTFSPAWWDANYYAESGRRLDLSAVAGRKEDGRLRHEFLLRRYGGVDLAGLRGVKDAYRRTGAEDYGTVMLPGLLGCRIGKKDGYWWAEEANYTGAQLLALDVPDPAVTYPFTMALEQLERIEAAIGRENLVNPYETVNIQGPLNIALKLRGDRFLTDMLENPAMAHRALDLSTRMVERVVEFFRQRFGPLQVRHDYGYCIAHCPLVMISPAMYEEFVLPYENRLADRTEYVTGRANAFELHHCTSVIDPYLPAYKKVRHLSKIDGGDLATDFRRVKRELPGVRVDVNIDSFRIRFQSMDEFLGDVNRLLDDGVDRICWDVIPEIPDAKVFAFLKTVGAL